MSDVTYLTIGGLLKTNSVIKATFNNEFEFKRGVSFSIIGLGCSVLISSSLVDIDADCFFECICGDDDVIKFRSRDPDLKLIKDISESIFLPIFYDEENRGKRRDELMNMENCK